MLPLTDTKAVSIWIRQFYLASPRFVVHLDAEFGGNVINIVNVEVHQCVWSGITLVFRKM